MDTNEQEQPDMEFEDTNEQDQPDMNFEDTFSDQSVHSDSLDSSDILEESELRPRVGDEYQAEIPSLLTPSEQLKYFSNPCESQPWADSVHDFLLGPPIQVRLAFNGAKSIKDEGAGRHDSTNCVKMEANECVTECSSVSDKKELIIKCDSVNQKCIGNANGYSFVPGLPGDSWSEFEVECFLLGLYFFRKNLLEVKEFMEVKEMGQILSFYYQRFYRTPRYQRWVDFRKIKGRRCIIGLRIISGSRQPLFLSRLLPHLSEVSRDIAVEAYRALMDGRTSLFEYVSTLKSMVGIRTLVEAVRIGKNGDLAVMAMESSRSNATISSRSEVPPSKECSSLTYEEIVQYLTGRFRLSKARSSDLFWEAVWPRLLAKGWHSEKPKDEAYITRSRYSLVFLLPGVKKFKRKLLKGDHYFDSVSDVLKKVASKPELLLLESEENRATPSVKGNRCGSEPNSDEDGGSDLEHQQYLKPRSSSSDAAKDMKFTIVDTSLFSEDKKQSMVKELRSLPDEMKASLTKRQFEQKAAKQNSDYTLKRRKLNPCTKAEKKSSIRRCSKSSLTQQNFVLSLPAHPKKPVRKKAVSPRNVSPIVAVSHEETCHQPQPLFDLNIPQAPSEPDPIVHVEDVKLEALSEPEPVVYVEDVKLEEGNKTVPHLENSEQDEQANANGRRHSTRIRPLSTKALEALESSFFNPKAGKKRRQAVADQGFVDTRS